MSEFHEFKVVVAGPFAAGKTTLIRRISDGVVVGTEQPTTGAEADVKATTTVGMEYGTYTVDDEELSVRLHLYGVPGQKRFSFMWDIVSDGMDGLVLLVDGTRPATWPEAIEVGRHFEALHPTPVVVAVNRAGDDGALVERVRAATGPLDAAYVACDVTEAASASTVLVELLLQVMDQLVDSGGVA